MTLGKSGDLAKRLFPRVGNKITAEEAVGSETREKAKKGCSGVRHVNVIRFIKIISIKHPKGAQVTCRERRKHRREPVEHIWQITNCYG